MKGCMPMGKFIVVKIKREITVRKGNHARYVTATLPTETAALHLPRSSQDRPTKMLVRLKTTCYGGLIITEQHSKISAKRNAVSRIALETTRL
jgi:hypothetical protein